MSKDYRDYQEFSDAVLSRINQPDLFSSQNGITVTEVAPGMAKGYLAISPKCYNPRRIVHGGALSTLMDTVAGIAACSYGRSCVTLNCTTNFMRAVVGSEMAYCTASCVKTGKTICVVECQVTDDNGKTVTTGTYTFFLMEPIAELFDNLEKV